MKTKDKFPLLRLVYQGLSDKKLTEIAELSHVHSYPADYLLCHEGAYEDVLYIIADGRVSISQKMVDGEGERTLRVSGIGAPPWK